MNNLRKLALIMASFGALAACARTSPPDTAADQAAIRAVQNSWYKAYNSGDGAAVAALYAEDAVLSAPHVPAARGGALIREYFLKDAATFTAAGLKGVEGPTSDDIQGHRQVGCDGRHREDPHRVSAKGREMDDHPRYLEFGCRQPVA